MEVRNSLFLSLNFEGKELPRRVELVPPGDIAGRDGRRWKNSNPEKVVKTSMARLPRLVIDINHATDLAAPKGGESPAAGWVKSLCAEGGAIYGEVEWTPRGEAALLNREYSFLSPVFLSDEKGEINTLLRAALTNTPNLNLPALNSENADGNNVEEKEMKKDLCAALGLPESATDAEVLAAVNAQKEKAALNAEGGKVDLAVYAPRAEVNAALERAVNAEKQIAELNAAQLRKDAEAAVDGAIAEGKFPPANRDLYLAMCSDQSGIERFRKIAEATPAIVDGKVQTPEKKPESAQTPHLNAEEAAFCKEMGYSAEEWQKIKGDEKK
ncbi:MAG: Mu phage protease GpI [Treponematales bacterium]